MGLIDKFLDAIKLNDDFDEEEEYLDDFDEEDEEYADEKVGGRFFSKFGRSGDDTEPEDEPAPAPRRESVPREDKAQPKPQTAVKKDKPVKKAPAPKPQRRRTGSASMEVSVIRPSSMEDARDITDTLLDECTVVLNLEGLDVDVAQRIIDFTCGSCYSLGGSIQMISSYIFILTPSNVDITGDYQDILSDAFAIPAMKSQY